jgi:hypothetical protein
MPASFSGFRTAFMPPAWSGVSTASTSVSFVRKPCDLRILRAFTGSSTTNLTVLMSDVSATEMARILTPSLPSMSLTFERAPGTLVMPVIGRIRIYASHSCMNSIVEFWSRGLCLYIPGGQNDRRAKSHLQDHVLVIKCCFAGGGTEAAPNLGVTR